VKKSFLSDSPPTTFDKKTLDEMKKEFKRTCKYLKNKHDLDDEEFVKELSDEVFDECIDRKISFYENFSRIDSKIL
jgi:hypothetical protein